MEQSEQEENPFAPIDLSIFKESIEQNLLTIVNLISNQEKTLVLEKSCITKFGFLIKTDFLSINQFKKEISLLEPTPPNTKTPIMLYIIPPKKECLIMIEKHIKDNFDKTSKVYSLNNAANNNKKKGKEKIEEEQPKEIKKEFHIIFIPKVSTDCNTFLKDSNFSSFYHTYNLNMDIFPLDHDLISIENDNSFYDLYLAQNLNTLSILVRAIIKYENIFGKIKYKYYLGPLAKKLSELLSKEEDISIHLDKSNDLSTFSCFIFDRRCDLITPLCSNFIYEGLLDEYFGINLNSIKVDPAILGKKGEKKLKLDLSRKEKFYSNIKDYNFDKIKIYLNARLKEHSRMLEDTKNKDNNKDLKRIQENILAIKLVKEERPSLTNQINLADYISKKKKLPKEQQYLYYEQNLLSGEVPSTFFEFIEDELAKKSELYNIIRILSLYSIINGGMKNKLYDQIKKDIINIYGFQTIFFLQNLEKNKMLKYYESSNLFYNELNKKLKLINDSVDLNNPNDTSYSFSGYCPIFIRLLEKAFAKGWINIKDILLKLSSDFDFPQDDSQIFENKNEKKFILLVFIGGLTYGELAAIRFMNKIYNDKKFIVVTSNMINNRKLMNSLRQGIYSYIAEDEAYINNGNENSFQINPEGILNFKDFDEQINK